MYKALFALTLLPLIGIADDCCMPACPPPECNPAECNIHDGFQGIIAPHGIECGFYIDAEYHYYQAIMDDLHYANQILLSPSPIPNALATNSTLFEPKFEWNSGVGLEAGYIFGSRDQLKLSLAWNYLTTHAKGSFLLPNNMADPTFMQINSPTWLPGQTGQLLGSGSTSWHLKFNTLDLLIGRDFFVSRWLSINPFFGLRGAWIEQKTHINYNGFNFLTIPSGGGYTDLNFERTRSLFFDNDMKAIGFRFGSSLLAHITCNVSVLGSLSASLLYSHFNVKGTGDTAFPSDDVTNPVQLGIAQSTFHNIYKRIRYNVDSELGLEWESYFCDNQRRLTFSASYLFSVWFNMLMLNNSFTGTAPDPVGAPGFPAANIDPGYQIVVAREGNLQLQGLIIRLGFDF